MINVDKQDRFAGRFKVVDVHEGGMAQVLICHDIHNGRFVAAKNPNEAPEYFSREARLWLGLGYHPNIVRAHTVHKVNGRPYLFMDFIGDSKGNSHNLRHEFNTKKVSLDFILKVGMSVVIALRHAQSIFPGFVHRDIKPENILINDEGNIFVSDFGIGRLPKYGPIDGQLKKNTPAHDMLTTGSTSFTKVGSFSGTIGYAAPEQYIDSSSVTFKADIFSLGVMLYEALTGRMPFNPQEIQEEGLKILQNTPDFDSATYSAVPTELRNIVIKMLQFSPAYRPESLNIIEKTFQHLAIQTFERADRQIVLKQAADKDSITISNLIYSLIQLEELPLAKRAVLEFQRKHPWHFESPLLIRTLFQKMVENEDAWKFLKEVSWVNLLNPLKFITTLLIGLILFVPMLMAYVGSQQALPDYFFIKSRLSLFELISGVLLLSVLLTEKYINSRTGITLDKITLPGILLGIVCSFLFSGLGYPVLAVSGLKSIAAVILGGGTFYILAILSKGHVGGGTIKLTAMIGSFTGLMIIPIILVAAGIFVLQALFLFFLKLLFRKELKWINGRLSPGFFVKYNFQEIPASNALMFATWSVISWSGFKYLLNI